MRSTIENPDQVLEGLQKTQIEILNVIDRVCRENNLHYSLYAGTLLGAVRHKGFIPWDDDLDICMSREDYNRFFTAWNQEKPEGYILQNKENTPAFTQSFTKIRKDHTTFLQSEKEANAYHTGIFVDIFPIDRIPDGKVYRIFYWWNCMCFQLLMREFTPPKSGKIVRMVSGLILKLIPVAKRPAKRKKLLNKLTAYNVDPTCATVAIETMGSMRQILPQNLLDAFVELDFGERKYMCFAQWDEYLRRKYHDYMQFPPIEEQVWKHHPLVIDFEHNYNELK